MDVDEVVFLGTGFSLPTARRHAISTFLNGDRGVLIDAGGDPAKGLAVAGHLAGVDVVVLTHHHTDHVGGFPGLVHALRFTDRDRPLHVAALPAVIETVQRACGSLDARSPYGIEWTELEPAGGPVRVGGIDIRTAPADHSVPALAVRVGGVVYSSDTRPAASVADLSRGARLLIHEATHVDAALVARTGHSTPADAGGVARKAGVAALALVHVHPSVDPAQAVEAAGFSPAWAPADGDRLRWQGSGWRFHPVQAQ